MLPVKPTRLKPNSTIGIFTPSEPITLERQPKLLQGINKLKSHGFSIKLSKNCKNSEYYMAGTVEERIEDINELLEDDSVDLLMASWGGKSCCQLLPHLDYDLIHRIRKPICGFSDGGVLVNAIFAKSGLISFYGPNVVGKLNETDNSNLQQFFLDGIGKNSKVLPISDEFQVIAPGIGEGRLVGGNLSTFVNSISGTLFEPSVEDVILVFESGKKTAQEFDFLFTSIVLSPIVNKIRGIVIGDCDIKYDIKWGKRSLFDIAKSVFGTLDFPIIYNPVFGHKKLPNPPLPIGCTVSIDSSNGELLTLENPFS